MSNQFVEDLLKYRDSHPSEISYRVSDDGRFAVLKYTRDVQFAKASANKWNDFTRRCRGLVIDTQSHDIVSYPFDKFFNYRIEPQADHIDLDEVVWGVRKINGFLAIVSKYHGELVVNTGGSIDSEFTDVIRGFIDVPRFLQHMDDDYTYMFECVSNDSDHVTKEQVGLTLLGMRKKEIGSEIINDDRLVQVADDLGVIAPDIWFNKTMGDFVELSKSCDFEGFVLYASGGRMVKLKGKKFLFKRALAGLTEKTMHRIFNNIDADLDVEELVPIINHIQNHVDDWLKMSHFERVQKIKALVDTDY